MSKININNIIIGDKAIEKQDSLIAEILFEYAVSLGLDEKKPVTAIVSLLSNSHKEDK